MPRYPQRPWYSPLGFMATTPQSYAIVVFTMGFFVGFPFRYRLSEWYERQRLTEDSLLRAKAVCYYRELDLMHRRQILQNHQMWQQSDMNGHTMSATMSADALKSGNTDFEYQYWYAHQRDAIRAEKLLKEVEELQAKVSA